MQTNEPVIHTMYEKMSSLLYNLMRKFLTRSSITELIDGKTKAKQGSNLVSVEISKNQMNLDSIDIGKKKCLTFYITTVEYMMLKLPITCKILKDAQYLHPNKRNCSASLNAIERLWMKVSSSLKNHLQSVFDVSDSTTVSEVCDMVRSLC